MATQKLHLGDILKALTQEAGLHRRIPVRAKALLSGFVADIRDLGENLKIICQERDWGMGLWVARVC